MSGVAAVAAVMALFAPAFPTEAHARAADAIVRFFAHEQAIAPVNAVLLTNSCARGCATPDSCLDILVLAPENSATANRAALTAAWCDHYASAPVFDALRCAGRFSVVHLDVHDGVFAPGPREDDEDIGDFEL